MRARTGSSWMPGSYALSSASRNGHPLSWFPYTQYVPAGMVYSAKPSCMQGEQPFDLSNIGHIHFSHAGALHAGPV